MIDSLAVIWSIGRKDLLLELRNKDVVVAVAGFALLIMVIFTFSLNLSQDSARLIGPGVLWSAVAFAGVTGLNRAFSLAVSYTHLRAHET